MGSEMCIRDSTLGIMTNLGAAHQEGFASEKHKLNEKLQLFDEVETLIYCIDHQAIHHAVKKTNSVKWTANAHPEADIRFSLLTQAQNKSTITVHHQQTSFEFNIPFTDANALENAMHCCATLLVIGWNSTNIIAGMADPVSYTHLTLPTIYSV